MAACTASGEARTSSKGFPDCVMSSSSDGTEGKAGDWGSNSAACAVGTTSGVVETVADVDVDAEDEEVAAAETVLSIG